MKTSFLRLIVLCFMILSLVPSCKKSKDNSVSPIDSTAPGPLKQYKLTQLPHDSAATDTFQIRYDGNPATIAYFVGLSEISFSAYSNTSLMLGFNHNLNYPVSFIVKYNAPAFDKVDTLVVTGSGVRYVFK